MPLSFFFANASFGISLWYQVNGETLSTEATSSKTFLPYYAGQNQLRTIPLQATNDRYVQPRAYFKLEDHRFDKLQMVGEGQWDEQVNSAQDHIAPVTDMPMAEI